MDGAVELEESYKICDSHRLNVIHKTYHLQNKQHPANLLQKSVTRNLQKKRTEKHQGPERRSEMMKCDDTYDTMMLTRNTEEADLNPRRLPVGEKVIGRD